MPSDRSDISPQISDTRTFDWQVQGQKIAVQYNLAGEGTPVLLLPAMGAVSTRAEMWPLARQLQRRFRTIAVDWPGFGAVPRPPIRWQPAYYQAFLDDFCAHMFDGPVAVVAAGHSAAYVMQLAGHRPAAWSRIALIAPTWRGPLPTVLGCHRWLLALPRHLLQLPLLGEGLYRLSVMPTVLARMYRSHVYGNPDGVTQRLIAEKGLIARQRFARYASAAFFTGALDAVHTRTEFLGLVDHLLVPLLAVCGSQTPTRSWQEMAALCTRSDVLVNRVPGALAPHEEHPAPVSRAVVDFLLSGQSTL
jgi:pimeloyl-ACP methyl ester carboxylesterase